MLTKYCLVQSHSEAHLIYKYSTVYRRKKKENVLQKLVKIVEVVISGKLSFWASRCYYIEVLSVNIYSWTHNFMMQWFMCVVKCRRQVLWEVEAVFAINWEKLIMYQLSLAEKFSALHKNYMAVLSSSQMIVSTSWSHCITNLCAQIL